MARDYKRTDNNALRQEELRETLFKGGLATLGALGAVASGHGEASGQHEKPLSVGRRVPRPRPVSGKAHHGKPEGRDEFGRFERRGRWRKVARAQREIAVFEMRPTVGIDKKAQVFHRDEHQFQHSADISPLTWSLWLDHRAPRACPSRICEARWRSGFDTAAPLPAP